MKRYAGGDVVSGGYYWNLALWEIVPIRTKKAPLPGTAADKYLECPLWAIPVVVVVMGASAVFFVPAIGFLMVFYAIYVRLAGKPAPAAEPAKNVSGELPKG